MIDNCVDNKNTDGSKRKQREQQITNLKPENWTGILPLTMQSCLIKFQH